MDRSLRWWLVALLIACPAAARGQALFQQAREVVEAAGQPAVAQRAEEPKPKEDEEAFDEGLFEDAKEPGTASDKPAAPPSEPTAPPPANRKLMLDAVVVVDYLFYHSPDRFKVKYHLNLSGEIPQDVTVLKGSAKISTDVSGYLAKWAQGECLLKVSISEVPYEITFKKNGNREADVEVKFPQPIMEDWESLCTFLDDPNAKLNTRGNPEKWVAAALEKTSPSLNRLVTPLSAEEATTLKFTIAKHTVKDENIGSAEIDGTGAITIQPGTPAAEGDKTAANR